MFEIRKTPMASTDEEVVFERAELLRQGWRLDAQARNLKAAADFAGEVQARRQASAVRTRYTEILPDVAVARCPASGAEVRYGIDTVDLDGWFWAYDNPWRRQPTLPPTWLAMCGAVLLRDPVASAPFRCHPGPGLPYVVPRILSEAGVRAVVNEIPIGHHTGWAITYFGPKPPGVMLENTWGANTYTSYADDGTWLGVADHETSVEDYDFDLTPWLEEEKLLWISAGDDTTELRSGTSDCPYTGLTGERRKASIFRGEVRRYS